MHLLDELVDGDGMKLCHFGVKVGDGGSCILVGLQKEAVEGTDEEGFFIEARTEAEVEGPSPRSPRGEEGLLRQFKELCELLGITTIAVPNPGLSGF